MAKGTGAVVLAGVLAGAGVLAFVLLNQSGGGALPAGLGTTDQTGVGPGAATAAAGAGPATSAPVHAEAEASGPSGPAAAAGPGIGGGAGGGGAATVVPAAEVRVRVRSAPTEKGIAGAKVRAVEAGGTEVSAESDADGRVRLTGLTSGSWRLEATAAGFELATRDGLALGSTVGVDVGDVDLTPRPAIRGTVANAKGEPAAGATVEVVNEVALKLGPDLNFVSLIREIQSEDRVFARTTTDATGVFVVSWDGLAPGSYGLRASATDFAPGFANVTLAADQTAEAKLAVATPVGLSGRVVDPAGAGIPDCAVVATTDPDEAMLMRERKMVMHRIHTRTNGEGAFAFPAIRTGKYMLMVGGNGRTSKMEQNVRAPREDLEIVLPPGFTLTGLVTDARTGRPIADVEIGAGGDGGLGSGVSGEDGRYTIAGLSGQLEVFVQTKGYAPFHSRLKGEATGERRLDIPLTAGISITGRVVRALNKAPVAGARVFAMAGRGMMGLGGAPAVTTAADGTFAIHGLSPEGETFGEVHVSGGTGGTREPPRVQAMVIVRADGVVQGTPTRVDLVAGENPTVEIVVESAGRVSGRVTDLAGTPVAGASVSPSYPLRKGEPMDEGAQTAFLMAMMSPESTITTGADGTFVLPSVKPGTSVRLVARKDGHAVARSAPFEVRADVEVKDLKLVLGAGSRVVVQLSGADGRPIAGQAVELQRAQVTIRSAGGDPAEAEAAEEVDPMEYMMGGAKHQGQTDAQGRFVFAGVSAGRYTVKLADGGTLVATTHTVVEVAEGRDASAAITLAEGLAISGIVRDAKGAAVSGAWVSAWTEGNGGGGQARTDARGEWKIQGLAPGTYHLWAGLDQLTVPEQVKAAAGASGVELRLKAPEGPAPIPDAGDGG